MVIKKKENCKIQQDLDKMDLKFGAIKLGRVPYL